MPCGLSKSARAALGITSVIAISAIGVPAAQASIFHSAPGVTTGNSFYPAPGTPWSGPAAEVEASMPEPAEDELRVATLEAGLFATQEGSQALEQLIGALETGNHSVARAVAQTAQISAPDVLVLTGVSYDSSERIAQLLRDRYLASGQHGESGLEYPYYYTSGTNSGLESGADLDRDGAIGGPGDAIGAGNYPGERGVVVFSQYAILDDEVRTFQEFLWEDLPENSMDTDLYSSLEKSILRLHQTSLWDVPVDVEGETVHVIAHAIAAANDEAAEEDLARAEDERRVLADYVSGRSWYLYDDDGELGGLDQGESFVLAGHTLPADAGDAEPENLDALLEEPGLQDPEPEAVSAEPLTQRSSSADSADPAATHRVEGGNHMRSSFVLPSQNFGVSSSGVFWPAEGEYGYELVDPQRQSSLNDRLVWADLTLTD